MKVSIIGAGAFGYSWAKYISEIQTEFSIFVFDVDETVISLLKNSGRHPYFFTDYRIQKNVYATGGLQEAIHDADLVILALPSHHVRNSIKSIKPYLKKDVHILNASKGLEIGTLKPINTVVSEELIDMEYSYAVVSGGMIAGDFFYGKPLGAQLGVQSLHDAELLLQIIQSERLEIQVTEGNISEIEILGSIKNVIAIYCGYLEGLGYPIGTISYELCKVIQNDIPKLLKSLGGRSTVNFSDFSYGGDLLTTVFGDSRSKYFGRLLGEGLSLDSALERLKSEHKLSEGYVLLTELLKHPNFYSQVDFLKRLHSIS